MVGCCWWLAIGGLWRLAVGGSWWSLGAVVKGGGNKNPCHKGPPCKHCSNLHDPKQKTSDKSICCPLQIKQVLALPPSF